MTDFSVTNKLKYTDRELQALVGKHILVGVVCCGTGDSIISREQFHGHISRISLQAGVTVRLNNSSEERTVPLDFTSFEIARPGEYRLTGTDEIVNDPEYTMRVTVKV